MAPPRFFRLSSPFAFWVGVILLNNFPSSSCHHEALILSTFAITLGSGACSGWPAVPHRYHHMGWGQQQMWIPDVRPPLSTPFCLIIAQCAGRGHNMDPSVVGSDQFGVLWKALLPGNYRGFSEQVYSQPLVYTLDDGIQYLFIATTQNNVYKLNAKTGALVLSRSLHVPFLTADLDGCVDINPTVGVTATGVIDP